MEQTVQGIYREHGWPNTQQYFKGECLEAVQKAMESIIRNGRMCAKRNEDLELGVWEKLGIYV
jgi:hypothetical protein